MDCTFPCSSATQRLLRRDEEQQDQWKYTRRRRSRYHHNEHSLSPIVQGCQNSRLEPLECRDLLIQNALFTGDLEMVQKYFTKSAAINLVIETKGDELRWTSRKFERLVAKDPLCQNGRAVDEKKSHLWESDLRVSWRKAMEHTDKA